MGRPTSPLTVLFACLALTAAIHQPHCCFDGDRPRFFFPLAPLTSSLVQRVCPELSLRQSAAALGQSVRPEVPNLFQS